MTAPSAEEIIAALGLVPLQVEGGYYRWARMAFGDFVGYQTGWLVWLANLAALELHTLLAPGDDPGRPSFVAFDLDPGPPADVLDAAWAASMLRELLDESGLKSFPKVSGGKGIHVYVPVNRPVGFDETKGFAHAVARLLEKRYPERVTSVMRKDLRRGKVFVDWSQNDPHKTTVSVYSLRARQKPVVSAPVAWDELDEARKLHRQAQMMWDFVAAENSMGFHNPEETLRILAKATDTARQAQLMALQAAGTLEGFFTSQ